MCFTSSEWCLYCIFVITVKNIVMFLFNHPEILTIVWIFTCQFTINLFMLDFVFKQVNNTPYGEPVPEPAPSTSTSSNVQPRLTTAVVTEDDVDQQLSKLDGKIQRKRDEKLYVIFFTTIN